MNSTMEKRFRAPRIWSNMELKKFASFFSGNIINVSAWQDSDKEGSTYASYFTNAAKYVTSNHPTLPKGYQKQKNEILLDLERELPHELRQKFSVVFNHTVLEHVFDFNKAIENLCAMSSDVVITVVPFMQQMHGFYDEGGYGDYWRFTPLSLEMLFAKHGYESVYLAYNQDENTSVYVLYVCSRTPQKWKGKFPQSMPYKDRDRTVGGFPAFIGYNMVSPYCRTGFSKWLSWVKKVLISPLRSN